MARFAADRVVGRDVARRGRRSEVGAEARPLVRAGLFDDERVSRPPWRAAACVSPDESRSPRPSESAPLAASRLSESSNSFCSARPHGLDAEQREEARRASRRAPTSIASTYRGSSPRPRRRWATACSLGRRRCRRSFLRGGRRFCGGNRRLLGRRSSRLFHRRRAASTGGAGSAAGGGGGGLTRAGRGAPAAARARRCGLRAGDAILRAALRARARGPAGPSLQAKS